MAVDNFGEEIDEYEDYRETHSEDGKRRKWTAGKIAKKICGWCVLLIIAAIMFSFISRVIQLDTYPEGMEAYYWTDKTVSLYDAGQLKCYELYIPQNFSGGEFEDSVSGDFFVVFARLTETEGNMAQIQFTIRYNDSTLSHRGENYTADKNTEEPFEFVLSDDLGHNYKYCVKNTDKKGNLNYRKLVFEDVDMSGVNRLYVNIYHSDSFDFDEVSTNEIAVDGKAFSGVRLFNSTQTYTEYKMNKKDLAAKETYK